MLRHIVTVNDDGRRQVTLMERLLSEARDRKRCIPVLEVLVRGRPDVASSAIKKTATRVLMGLTDCSQCFAPRLFEVVSYAIGEQIQIFLTTFLLEK